MACRVVWRPRGWGVVRGAWSAQERLMEMIGLRHREYVHIVDRDRSRCGVSTSFVPFHTPAPPGQLPCYSPHWTPVKYPSSLEHLLHLAPAIAAPGTVPSINTGILTTKFALAVLLVRHHAIARGPVGVEDVPAGRPAPGPCRANVRSSATTHAAASSTVGLSRRANRGLASCGGKALEGKTTRRVAA